MIYETRFSTWLLAAGCGALVALVLALGASHYVRLATLPASHGAAVVRLAPVYIFTEPRLARTSQGDSCTEAEAAGGTPAVGRL